MKYFFLFLFVFMSLWTTAQKIDNMASYRELQSERYFRVNYDNDFFGAQDENYTQGYSFELVTPALVKNPINKIFLNLNGDKRRVGIVFKHIGFTPNQYEKLDIQVGDRPFAAAAMLKSFSISTNSETKQRFASHFSFGIMGPVAQGKEIQAGIHRLTGDRVPYGWIHQIENHFVLNYGVDYEKELVRVDDNFALYGNASGKIGTLFTNATLGFNTTFGLINNPYKTSNTNKTFQLYGYIQPLVSAVGYDATLQGGLIGDNSIYTIPASDVNRVVGQVNYGIVLQTKSLYLEYSRSNISKEIKTLFPAAYGGIKIGFRI